MWHRRLWAGPEGAGSGGRGPADSDRLPALGCAPRLALSLASLRHPARGSPPMTCPPSAGLPVLPAGNPGWSHESGEPWPSKSGLRSTSSCALSSPDITILGAGLGRGCRDPARSSESPRDTERTLLAAVGARRGRVLCPHCLTLQKEQLHLDGLKVDFVFSRCITA
ncbi:hypothetical protein mRhiFer1_010070 [Rhinolophus ferrumequinum]|uniref:Uncharacterized protein n=1 Tax=Rhinolophus ferrumequinum TaxID=59479 RepID=A0A7J7Y5F1_RHIFE|nr:hypothetical protein mRhiFer1_010070 [Rhinolophus ferrumequinum]